MKLQKSCDISNVSLYSISDKTSSQIEPYIVKHDKQHIQLELLVVESTER